MAVVVVAVVVMTSAKYFSAQVFDLRQGIVSSVRAVRTV